MVELSFTEDHERQIILCSTPKRKIKVKVFVPIGSFARWHITYEDGRQIEGLSENTYTSRKLALQAVVQWEQTIKKSKDAKQYELFGDKEPPILRRKQVRNGARAKTNTS